MGRPLTDEATIARLRDRYQAGETQDTIARAENVSPQTVGNLARRYGWTRPEGHRPRRPAARRQFGQGDRCPGLSVCPLRGDLVGRLYGLVRARLDAEADAFDLKQCAGLVVTLDKLVRAEATGLRSRADAEEGSNDTDLAADADRIRGELLARARRLADAGTAGPQTPEDQG